MNPCDLFRERLERALRERFDAECLRVLGWHEHLFACMQCRALLQSEEALETLLDGLPAVELPADLTTRVLARLEAMRVMSLDDEESVGLTERRESNLGTPANSLDRLLERDHGLPLPPGLGARTFRAVKQQRNDAALDRLLARVPMSPAPADLSSRILRKLEAERASRLELVPLALRWAWAAGAVGLLTLGAWLLGPQSSAPETRPSRADNGQVAGRSPVDVLSVDPDPELLASLDLLENWDLLLSDDVDVFLGGLGSIGELGAEAEDFSGQEISGDEAR